MTNADKLFEKCFFKQETNNVDYIGYKNNITNGAVAFWKKKHTASISNNIEITSKLLQAITEKFKELGWLI